MKYLQASRVHGRFAVGLRLALASGLAWGVAGCGGSGGVDRHRVSGKVTFAGKPIPGGQIVFEPDVAAGNRGPQGSAQIVDGQYDVGKNGTVGGAHIARITGFDGKLGGGASPKPLFNPYDLKVDLGKGTVIKDFEVPAEAAKGLVISNTPPP